MKSQPFVRLALVAALGLILADPSRVDRIKEKSAAFVSRTSAQPQVILSGIIVDGSSLGARDNDGFCPPGNR